MTIDTVQNVMSCVAGFITVVFGVIAWLFNRSIQRADEDRAHLTGRITALETRDADVKVVLAREAARTDAAIALASSAEREASDAIKEIHSLERMSSADSAHASHTADDIAELKADMKRVLHEIAGLTRRQTPQPPRLPPRIYPPIPRGDR